MSTADFIERRLIHHFENTTAALNSAAETLRDRGATYFRYHARPHPPTMIVEGWREQPREQGDIPL